MRLSRRFIYFMVGVILVSVWGSILPEGLRIVASFRISANYSLTAYVAVYAFLIGPIVAGSIMIGCVVNQVVRHKKDMFFEMPEEKNKRELDEIQKLYNKGKKQGRQGKDNG